MEGSAGSKLDVGEINFAISYDDTPRINYIKVFTVMSKNENNIEA